MSEQLQLAAETLGCPESNDTGTGTSASTSVGSAQPAVQGQAGTPLTGITSSLNQGGCFGGIVSAGEGVMSAASGDKGMFVWGGNKGAAEGVDVKFDFGPPVVGRRGTGAGTGAGRFTGGGGRRKLLGCARRRMEMEKGGDKDKEEEARGGKNAKVLTPTDEENEERMKGLVEERKLKEILGNRKGKARDKGKVKAVDFETTYDEEGPPDLWIEYEEERIAWELWESGVPATHSRSAPTLNNDGRMDGVQSSVPAIVITDTDRSGPRAIEQVEVPKPGLRIPDIEYASGTGSWLQVPGQRGRQLLVPCNADSDRSPESSPDAGPPSRSPSINPRSPSPEITRPRPLPGVNRPPSPDPRPKERRMFRSIQLHFPGEPWPTWEGITEGITGGTGETQPERSESKLSLPPPAKSSGANNYFTQPWYKKAAAAAGPAVCH
ncbi:hypothetical protein QBC44DRAFT_399222 [Cladorrhinum sp. PSN332]|nr:hypothetical protein QBC44DRAFT_399222 [Cladorrhinum sp. PSN332]